jgi:hypothetical protein
MSSNGTTRLVFTLEGDQQTLIANFGAYLPIQINGTLQSIVSDIASIQATLTAATNAETAANTASASSQSAATNSAASAAQAQTSATSASTQASNATNSATAAASSASQAAASASAASTSASTISADVTAAATSATNAATSATNASNSAAAAATSVSSASTSATNAANSATAASTSATNAGNSASIAYNYNNLWCGSGTTDPTKNLNGGSLVAGNLYFNTSENKLRVYSGSAWGDYDATAQTAATNAASSASAASTSATGAGTSASNAASSATAASTSASNASASATTATTQATNASASASSASTSATNAANSASSASTSATTATNEANTASTQATNASTSATNASTSASSAGTFATNAANSATLAENWAILTTGTVDGTNYSAKYWAEQAQAASGTAGVASFNTRTGAVTFEASDISGVGGALLASPAFTGNPTAPTATAGTNSTQLANTAFVTAAIGNIPAGVTSFNARTGAITLSSADVTTALGFAPANSAILSLYAPLASPTLTGDPTAPTATSGTNTTQIATTAFVQNAVSVVTGGLDYIGTWNASTNTPTITSGTGTKGQMYKVSAAGTTTVDGNSSWNVGDLLTFDGTYWDKIDGQATEVISFNTRTGAITLSSTDVTTALGFTPANTTAIPTNTNQLTNGSGYITASSLSTYAPIASPTFTGTVTIPSGASISGYAPLASPALTGSPTAPTATAGTSTTQVATTSFVTSAISTQAAVTVTTAHGGTGLTTLGTANQVLQVNSGATAAVWSSRPYDIALYIEGVTTASEVLLYFVATRAFTWPASLTGSYAKASVAATASTTFTILHNGSSVGSFAFAASGTTATFTFSSAITFALGDTIEITGPATPDTTLANIGITFAGTQ